MISSEPSVIGEVAASYPPRAVGWMTVFVLFLLYVLSFLDRSVLALLVGPIKGDLVLTDVQLSLLVGFAFAVSYTVGAIPAGWAVDRFPRRIVIFLGVIVWSLATMLSGLSRNFQSLFGARAIVGLGESVIGPGAESIIPDVFPRDQLALPISMFTMGGKVGQGAALIIGGALASAIPPASGYLVPVFGVLKGWQLILILVGAPGLLLAFLIFLIPEPRRFRAEGTKVAGYGEYFRFMGRNLRFFIPHHLGKLFYLALSLGIIAWSPAYFSRVFGWTEGRIGAWLGTALLLGPLIGMPAHGAIVDFLYRRGWSDIHMRYPMLAALAGLPIGLAAFWVSNPYWGVALIGLFFFVICNYASLPIVAVQAILPSKFRGKAASFMLVAVNLSATTLGPLAVATITDVIFRDPTSVGRSIRVCMLVLLPLVAILFYLTLKPLRALHAALPPRTTGSARQNSASSSGSGSRPIPRVSA